MELRVHPKMKWEGYFSWPPSWRGAYGVGLGPTERSAHSPDAKRRLRRHGWRHQCSPLGPPPGRPQRLNEGSSDEQ
jgi:hypothetical protein